MAVCCLMAFLSENPILGIQVNCVCGCWELTLRNVYRLGCPDGFTGERKAEYSTRICVDPGEWGQKVKRGHSTTSATELGIRLRDWTLRNGGRGNKQQLTYLFPWSEGPCVLRECLL